MNLKEFVSQSITEIVDGVRSCQDSIPRLTAHVNPIITREETGTRSDVIGPRAGHSVPLLFVEFDVAVVASKDESTKGGMGIFVAAFGVGATGESKNLDSQHSRIKFTIPVRIQWPEPKTEKPA